MTQNRTKGYNLYRLRFYERLTVSGFSRFGYVASNNSSVAKPFPPLKNAVTRNSSRTLSMEEGLWLAQVQVKPNESLDSALKRFKKVLQQTGVLKEAREHEHYEKPSDKRRKAEAARRRKLSRKS